MNLKNLMLAALALGALSCLIWFGLSNRSAPAPTVAHVAPPPPPAVVTQILGPVQVREATADHDRPTTPPDPLHLGDVISTGEAGEANVVFANQAIVHLGPNASLVIGDPNGGLSVGGVLLAGEARVQAQEGNHLGFRIGTPVGIVGLPENKLGEVQVQFDQGVKVLTGEVQLTSPGSDVGQVVLSGQEITLDGLKVAANSGVVDGLEVPAAPARPLSPTLRRRRGVVRTRAKQSRTWAQARARGATPIQAGDSILVGARGRATLRLDPAMRVELGAGARLRLDEAVLAEAGATAHALLAGGASEVALDLVSPPAQAHVRVSNTELHVAATDKEASVDVAPSADGAQVYVRYGSVHVGEAEPIAAGQVLRVRDGNVVFGPQLAHPDAAEAYTGRDVIIAADSAAAPVRFMLPTADATQGVAARHLQVAKDAAFAQIVTAERVNGVSFAHDRLPWGDSFWRTTDAPQAIGHITLQPARGPVCQTCRKDNVIADTGERVVVRYEVNAPSLTFTWAHVPGAQSYTWRLYRADDLDHPHLAEAKQETSHAVGPSLGVGTYYWYVDTHMGTSAPPEPGQMNTLTLDHQPANEGMDLAYPGLRQRTRSPVLTSVGHLDPKAKLTINGTTVAANAEGNFRHRHRLRPGKNQLVYRVVRPQLPDRVEMREVTLRP